MENNDMNDHDLLIRMDASLAEIKATLSRIVPQVEELQNDRTANKVNITQLQGDMKTLQTKSNLWDGINSALGLILAAIVALFQVQR